jgi:lipoprotein signal peptidase
LIRSSLFPLILFATVVIAADRFSKAAVTNWLGSGKVVFLGPGMRIRYVVTRFKRRGFLRTPAALVAIWTATLAGLVLATNSGYFFQRPAAQLGLAAAIAGSGSNLYDRLRQGAVIDFLDLSWWPASNLADIALVLGVTIALRFL